MHKNFLFSLIHNGFMDKGWYDQGMYTDHKKKDVYVPTKEEFYKYCPLSPDHVLPEGKRIGFKNGSICWVDCEHYKRNKIDNTRARRDGLLTELDKVVSNPLRYDTLTVEQKNVLSTYRDDLLDVPQQEGFPDDVKFPKKPEFLKG